MRRHRWTKIWSREWSEIVPYKEREIPNRMELIIVTVEPQKDLSNSYIKRISCHGYVKNVIWIFPTTNSDREQSFLIWELGNLWEETYIKAVDQATSTLIALHRHFFTGEREKKSSFSALSILVKSEIKFKLNLIPTEVIT